MQPNCLYTSCGRDEGISDMERGGNIVGLALARARSLSVFAASLVTLLLPAAEDNLREAIWKGIVTLRDGVTLHAYNLEKPRKMAVYVARIDLTVPGISFTGTERDPKWGKPIPDAKGSDKRKTIGTKRETTADFMMRRRSKGMNVEIAVNTSGFGPWERPFNHEYAGFFHWTYVCGEEISHKVKPLNAPYLIVRKNGKIDIRRGVKLAETNDIAIAMFGNGLLLKNGNCVFPARIRKRTCGDVENPRTALGLTADRRTLIIVAVDGRQPGYSAGARYPELAEILKREGATDAINFDGGGSTSLVVFDRKSGKPIMLNHQPKGIHRKVGLNLGIVFE